MARVVSGLEGVRLGVLGQATARPRNDRLQFALDADFRLAIQYRSCSDTQCVVLHLLDHNTCGNRRHNPALDYRDFRLVSVHRQHVRVVDHKNVLGFGKQFYGQRIHHTPDEYGSFSDLGHIHHIPV